ncbi:MAG: DUF2189 domain-containing protein [Rubrivivax sp.]
MREVNWRSRWTGSSAAGGSAARRQAWIRNLASTLFGLALVAFAHEHFWMLAGAFSGLLVAPVVASGLYAVSRGLERGEQPALADVWRLWLSLDRPRRLRRAAGAGRHRLEC